MCRFKVQQSFGYGIRKQCSSALFRAKKNGRGFRPPLTPPDSGGEFRYLPTS